MAWTTTTLWEDKEIESIDKAVTKITSKNGKDIIGTRGGAKNYYNVTVQRINSEEELSFNSLDSQFEYQILKGRCEYGKKDDLASRTVINFFIVVYKLENKVYYVINRNSDALKMLRSFLDYTAHNQVTQKNLSLTTSMILWFVKKLFSEETTISYILSDKTEYQLTILNILGLKGETAKSNLLSATGSSIMKLSSTLSLILESDYLDQVQLSICLENHEKVILKLQTDGVVAINKSDYIGNFEHDSKDKLTAELVLLAYHVIQPIIFEAFNFEIQKDLWNKQCAQSFVEEIKKQLTDGINAIQSNLKF